MIAPSHTPKKPNDRIKNDTRDAVTLARMLRAGELTPVWVPDTIHEAIRDLTRARLVASYEVRECRQRIQTFLLKLDLRYEKKSWTYQHRVWLANRRFDHAAQQIAFQSYLNAHEQAEARRSQLDGRSQNSSALVAGTSGRGAAGAQGRRHDHRGGARGRSQ